MKNFQLDPLSKNTFSAIQTADYYDKRWAQVGIQATPDRTLRIRFIIKALKHIQSAARPTILDLGCGNGWMAPFLYEFGTVTGIDYSPNAIELANEKLNEYGKFVLADPTQPGLGLGELTKFDIVICSEVIEHTLAPLELLIQIASFLETNGSCIFTTPNGNVWNEYKEVYRGTLQPIENWLTVSQCALLFSQAGYHVEWQLGGIHPRYRLGSVRWLQSEKVRILFNKLGLENLYGKLILQSSLYQFVLAKKRA